MNAFEILNKWGIFSNYNPNQTKFYLDGYSYEVKRGNDLISKIINDYDETGCLAVIFAKILCHKILENTCTTYLKILNNPVDYNNAKEMWDIFSSPDVDVIENNYISSIDALVRHILDKKAIGEYQSGFDKQKLSQAIEIAINSMEKCSLDLYLKGGKVNTLTSLSTQIHVYNTLAECLIELERTNDGIYLCYIENHDTLDGYFGFFIKSNGNLFSLNERVDEPYAGAHKNSRNGRYSESKQYELFPYNYIFSFGEHDYKGIANKHVIDKERLAFFYLGIDAYLPLVLAMLLIKAKYENKAIDAPLKYCDSLASVNVQNELVGEDKYSLAVIQNSLLIKSHKELYINFETNKVLDGSYNELYNSDNKSKNYKEKGTFVGENQIFVELYGNGFIVNNDALLERKNIKLLPSNETMPNNEFVGTKERLELQAYYNVRQQLADYIKKNMDEELRNFGSDGHVLKWYKQELLKHIGYFNQLVAQHCIDVQNGIKTELRAGWRLSRTDIRYDIVRIDDDYPTGEWVGNDFTLNNRKDTGVYTQKSVCNITDKLCNVFFVFKPRDWHGLMSLLENTKLPTIIRGWESERIYSGNSILNAVDPVAKIHTPFEERNNDGYNCDRCNFKFAIGYSKSGLNKLIKEYKIQKHLG